MDRIFPLPIYSFFKLAIKNGGISAGKIKNIPPWLIKTILLEPVRWIELALFNRNIQKHQIAKDPIFVLGYYRSGTSFLHQCLALDDRLGYHKNFQMVFPEIMLSTEKILLPVMEFICRVFNIQDSVHRVPLSFRFPGEEDATMATYLDPKAAQWGYFFPKIMKEQFQKYVLFENISPSEMEAWQKSFRYLLNKISIANQNKQLVLKSPPNTSRIKVLLSLFPKAKFIFIHRNPYEVYSSNKRFWTVVQKVFALQNTKSVDVNKIILDTYSQMTQRYLDEKNLIPEGQLSELAYDDFVQNPLEILRKSYEELGLGDFFYVQDKLETFASRQTKFKQLKHSLPEAEKVLVNKKLEPFLSYWNYPVL
jgi:hypothetical protein